MKKYVIVLIGALLSINLYAQSGNTYINKANVISVKHTLSKDDALKTLKGLLINDLYSIKTTDNEFYYIETDYKKLKNASVRLHILIKDSIVYFRSYATSGMSATVYGGGIGFNTGTSEFRGEYRSSKMTVMRFGFDEMERIAFLFHQMFDINMNVYKEE